MTERESLVELRGGAIEIHGWDFAFSATLDEKGRLGYFGASIEDDDVPTANLLAMLDADGCPDKRTAAWAIRDIVRPDEIVALLPPGTAWSTSVVSSTCGRRLPTSPGTEKTANHVGTQALAPG